VRDGDKEGSPGENIFKLPGTRAPEVEMFDAPAVAEFVRQRYGVSLRDFAASLGDAEHHEWFPRLATHCSVDQRALVTECATVFVGSLSEADRSGLVGLLKEAAS
jgi:hypothetical protein